MSQVCIHRVCQRGRGQQRRRARGQHAAQPTPEGVRAAQSLAVRHEGRIRNRGRPASAYLISDARRRGRDTTPGLEQTHEPTGPLRHPTLRGSTLPRRARGRALRRRARIPAAPIPVPARPQPSPRGPTSSAGPLTGGGIAACTEAPVAPPPSFRAGWRRWQVSTLPPVRRTVNACGRSDGGGACHPISFAGRIRKKKARVGLPYVDAPERGAAVSPCRAPLARPAYSKDTCGGCRRGG